MKSLTMNLMLATAALMVASTVASAQTLKAEIPFSFQAAGKLMQPGTYMITSASGETWFELRNLDDHKSIVLPGGVREDAPKAWRQAGNGALQFACNDGSCALNRVWSGVSGDPAHVFARPKQENGKPATLAVIRLVSSQGK